MPLQSFANQLLECPSVCQASRARQANSLPHIRHQALRSADALHSKPAQRQLGLSICRVVADEDVQQSTEVQAVDAELQPEDEDDLEETEEYGEDVEYYDPEPLVQPSPRPDVQQTLSKSFYLSNITQHTEKLATIRVRPALAGEGRYFVRVPEGSLREAAAEQLGQAAEEEQAAEANEEAEEQQAANTSGTDEADEEAPESMEQILPRGEEEDVVVASVENAVVTVDHCQFLTLEQGENRVFAVDGLLSALEACGVDNARIEFEGSGEMPLYDGSAVGFAHLIKWAGVRVAPAIDGSESSPKAPYSPQKVITVREGDSFISLMPGPSTALSCGVDHSAEARVIGKQWVSWAPSDSEERHYRWEIAPARTYFTSQKDRMEKLAQGYFKACYDELTIIAEGEEWADADQLRFLDEPARRRLQEFLGMLALLSYEGRGGIPQGHIVAFQADWSLQLRFLKAVRKVCEGQ